MYNGLERTKQRFLFGSVYTISCEEDDVGTYPLETIIREWKNGKLTSEQAIGQVLLLIQGLQKRLAELEGRIFRCEQARK